MESNDQEEEWPDDNNDGWGENEDEWEKMENVDELSDLPKNLSLKKQNSDGFNSKGYRCQSLK